MKMIGRGTYSACWVARDCKMEIYVCVKVYKAAPYFRDIAKQEFDVLLALNKLHRAAQQRGEEPYPFVKMLDVFTHSGNNGTHWCIVLELLGESLTDILEDCNLAVAPSDPVRPFFFEDDTQIHH